MVRIYILPAQAYHNSAFAGIRNSYIVWVLSQVTPKLRNLHLSMAEVGRKTHIKLIGLDR